MEELDSTQFVDIGSVNNFAEVRGLDPSDPSTLETYSQRLAERRRVVAAQIPLRGGEVHAVSGPASVDLENDK